MTSMLQTDNHCTIHADEGCTTFIWSLKNWTLLRDHYKAVASPEFVLHNTYGKTCKLLLQLEIGWPLSVFIQFPMGIQYHTMKASMSVLDENSEKLNTTETISQDPTKSVSLGFNFNMSEEIMGEYLRNDTLTMFFEFTVVTPVTVLRTAIGDTDFSTDICQNIKVILGTKYDVTFIVSGEQLYAHKVILMENSEVFKAMFTTKMKELENGTVEIVDTDATVFEAFLSYMYTGRVREIENMVDELIVVADKYQVMNLKRLCEHYMLNHINGDNVLTYLLKAHLLSYNELQKNCIDFVRANLHVLENSSDLAKLVEYPSLVSQLFKKDSLGSAVHPKS